MTSLARDVLKITGLETECVVGVHPHERDQPQPLRINLELRVDTESAARSRRLSRTIDYDATATQIVFLLRSCRFGLLETAAHALATFLLAAPAPGERRAQVHAVAIELIKPQALPGSAVASLAIERERAWASYRQEATAFGRVDVIHESRETGIYRVSLAPGQGAPLHLHGHAHAAELALSSGLLDGAEPIPAGLVRSREPGTERTYRNPTRRWQSLLCVDVRPGARQLATDESPRPPGVVRPGPRTWGRRRAHAV